MGDGSARADSGRDAALPLRLKPSTMTKGRAPHQDRIERHALQMDDAAARREFRWQAKIPSPMTLRWILCQNVRARHPQRLMSR